MKNGGSKAEIYGKRRVSPGPIRYTFSMAANPDRDRRDASSSGGLTRSFEAFQRLEKISPSCRIVVEKKQ